MESLAPVLALHGVLVLVVSLVAGLLLHRTIRLDGENAAAWRLAHAGVSGRGVLLIALAGAMPWLDLRGALLKVRAWLMLFFVWTSTAAMVLAAADGDRGLKWSGSPRNRLVYALYVVGAIAIFPAAFLLIAGFVRAR